MLVAPRSIIPIPILFLLFTFSLSARTSFNVLDYGAKSGGTIDSSNAFLDAWAAACTSTIPSVLYVPTGTFLLGTTTMFEGTDCKNSVAVQIDGTLVAPPDYEAIAETGKWIVFQQTDGIVVTGGILDARGENLWSCKQAGNQCPKGATSLTFYKSNNIQINGVTSINSQLFHFAVLHCNNVNIKGFNISAPVDSPNSDGIHISDSSDVNVTSSTVATGDDCISISPGSTNVLIENIHCGPGHGISIGSIGSEPNEKEVQNVTVRHCTLQGTQNGVRIKTWAKPSTSYVKQVIFQHITVVNSGNPIIIDQNYDPGNSRVSSGVQISEVTFQRITGTSSIDSAISINCSPTKPCKGITLQDINLTFGSKPAKASCTYVSGRNVGTVVPDGCIDNSVGKSFK